VSVLVMDVGSSSVRALIFDSQARFIPGAEARRPHQFKTSQGGEVSASPEALCNLVEVCIDEILTHPQAKTITAVGMACFVGNMLGVTSQNTPCTPLFTYADTRGADAAKTLKSSLAAADVVNRTGCPLHTAYYPVRLQWLWQTEPALTAKLAQWLDFGTWCYRTWFRRPVPASYSVMAWSGLLNRATLGWDTLWLDTLGLTTENLPPLAEFTQTQVGLSDPYKTRWPHLADVPFFLPIGDGAAANIGSGAVSADKLALTVGTTAALRRVSDETLPPVPDGCWSYRIDAKHHLLGGATSEGGNVWQWAQATLKLSSVDLEAALVQRQADSHGLTVLPLLAGERSPGWQAGAVGTIHGIHLATTPLDILQALLESVALRLALIAQRLLTHNAELTPLLMASGAALTASPVWGQMLANALNLPLQMVAETELTARGLAVLMLSHLHDRAWADYFPRVSHTLHPDPAQVTIFSAALERQLQLYQQLYG
jgi:gluconokinase